MIYTLKHPIKYTETKTISTIQFREPIGREAKKLVKIAAIIFNMGEDMNSIDPDIVDAIVDFTADFSEAIGHPDAVASMFAEKLKTQDILGIALEVPSSFLQ